MKAEHMGEGSVLERPHKVLLSYIYTQRKGASLFLKTKRHQEEFQQTGLAKFLPIYYFYLVPFDLSYFSRIIHSLSDLT